MSGSAQSGDLQAVCACIPAGLTFTAKAWARGRTELLVFLFSKGEVTIVCRVHARSQHIGNGDPVGAGTLTIITNMTAVTQVRQTGVLLQ